MRFGLFLFKILCCFFCLYTWHSAPILAQVEDFEKQFDIVPHPEEFLPGWSANEVRATASRVFQIANEGRNRSRALAVQPIGSFNGLIYFRTAATGLIEPKLAFFAKTLRNGSGNRPVLLFVSFSNTIDGEFINRQMVGSEQTFPNQNTDFSLYEIPIPEEFFDTQFIIRFEVVFGSGTGTAARFVMDDVGVFDGDAQVDPIQVKSTKILNPYTLEVVFDRPVQEIAKTRVRFAELQIESILFPTDTLMEFGFAEEIPTVENILEFESISSIAGEETEDISVVIPHERINLGRVSVISPDSLYTAFSKKYDAASVSQSSHFLINGRPPATIDLQEDGYSLTLSLVEDLTVDSEISIEVSNIKASDDADFILNQIRSIYYSDFVSSIEAISANEIILRQEVAFNSETLNDLAFRIAEEDFFFSVQLESLESIKLLADREFPEEQVLLLEIPSRESQRGLFLPGSTRSFVWDNSPPELVQVLSLGNKRLLLIFSEDLDPVFASIIGNFKLDGFEVIDLAFTNAENQILLTFNRDFQQSQDYVLTVMGLADLNGNFMDSQDFPFSVEVAGGIAFKDVVINEVMPAPRAGNSLPNVEYVELFNSTDQPIFLGGFQLQNSRRSTVLPPAVLDPKEYLILVPRTRVALFEPYGDVLGLTNWPTLLNAADRVKLLDDNRNPIDSLVYSTASYGSSELAQGGYSLEIINPFLKCNLDQNLRPSSDPRRGTPGMINSVFEEVPDLQKLEFLGFSLADESTIVLNFNKTLGQNISMLSWEASPSISDMEIKIGPSPSQLTLKFSQPLSSNQLFRLKLNNLRDCSGNLFDANATIEFVRPGPAEKGDIVINEVLFNPRSNAPKFVEIYNASEKFISLKDWKLASVNSQGEIANRRLIFNEDKIIAPGDFLVFTTDAEKLWEEYPKGVKSNFVQLPSLPSYPIRSGTVIVLDPDEKLVERLEYDDKMHHRLLKETRGVSLERISPFEPIDNPDNWQSASQSVGYASPGFMNSHSLSGDVEDAIEIDPKIFDPEGRNHMPFTTIRYRMKSPGMLGTIKIYSIGGHEIREICQNALWGKEGFYTWDGTEESGRKVRSGYYIIWVQFFDLEGKVNQVKKTVIVGANF